MATKLLSIDEIMKGVATQKLEVDAALKEKAAVMEKQVAAVDNQQAILKQIGLDAELLSLETSKRTQQAQLAVGVDEYSNYMLDMLARRKQLNDMVFEAAEEVTRKTRSTISADGPLGWLANVITTEESQERLKALTQQSTLMSTAIQQTNSDLKAILDGDGGRAIANTAQEIAAKARLASAEARLKVEDAVLKGLGVNAQAIEDARTASQEKVRIEYAGQGQILQIRQDQRAARSLSLQEENAARDKELHDLRVKMAMAEEKDKVELDVLSEDFADTVKLGQAALGLPVMDRTIQLEALKRFKQGNISDEMRTAYNVGRKVRENKGQQVFANSPAAAVTLLTDPKLDAKIAPAQQKTVDFVREAASVAFGKQGPDPKNAAANHDKINKQVNQMVLEQFGTEKGVDGPGAIGRDSVFNVGNIASPQAGYLSASAVKDLPLVTKILKPAQDNNVELSDPGVVLNLVRTAVQKNELTSVQAANGLADVYRVANRMNQAQRNFSGFSIDLPNQGKQYLVKIQGRKLDMTKPEHIQRMMMMLNRYGGSIPMFAFEGP